MLCRLEREQQQRLKAERDAEHAVRKAKSYRARAQAAAAELQAKTVTGAELTDIRLRSSSLHPRLVTPQGVVRGACHFHTDQHV